MRERASQKEALLSLQESARLSFPTRPQGPKVTKVAGGMNPTGPFTPTTTRTAAAGGAATSSAADDAATSSAAGEAASTAADRAASPAASEAASTAADKAASTAASEWHVFPTNETTKGAALNAAPRPPALVHVQTGTVFKGEGLSLSATPVPEGKDAIEADPELASADTKGPFSWSRCFELPVATPAENNGEVVTTQGALLEITECQYAPSPVLTEETGPSARPAPLRRGKPWWS